MTTNNNWTDEWLGAQQKIVGAWVDMAKDLGATGSTAVPNPWAESIDLWQKEYVKNATPDVQQVIEKCMGISKDYFTMAEQMGTSSSSGSNPFEIVNNWFEQLKTNLQQQADQWSPMSSQNSNEVMSQWFSPATSWQKMASTMLPIQQSLGQMSGIGTPAFNMGDAIDPLGKLMTAPGIGYFREPQEKMQKGVQLGLDYHESNAKFNQAFLRISVESIQGFQQQLQDRVSGKGAEAMPSSLRELYDEWIIVSEEHYAKFAMGEEYQTLYGDMVNRLMALKKHYSEMTDDMMKSMNLPARSEVDTMQIRLQQLRRDNFALQKELKEIRSLLVKGKQTVPAKKQVAAKDKQAATVKTVAKKSPARKKVSTTSTSKSRTKSGAKS
jgi:class III poly(R)-hydroxyalkanoic acid synthase PhaE subunit